MLAPRDKTGARFDLATLSGPSDFTPIVRVFAAFVGDRAHLAESIRKVHA
jgi:hypothetical protein